MGSKDSKSEEWLLVASIGVPRKVQQDILKSLQKEGFSIKCIFGGYELITLDFINRSNFGLSSSFKG